MVNRLCEQAEASTPDNDCALNGEPKKERSDTMTPLCLKQKPCVWLRHAEGDAKGVCIAGPRCVIREPEPGVSYDLRLKQTFKQKEQA